MEKRLELAHPQSCINKASPDEPIFVLRAKDPLAAQTVRLWAAMAFGMHEDDKVNEAHELSRVMDKWREDLMPVTAEEAFPAPPARSVNRRR